MPRTLQVFRDEQRKTIGGGTALEAAGMRAGKDQTQMSIPFESTLGDKRFSLEPGELDRKHCLINTDSYCQLRLMSRIKAEHCTLSCI